MTIYIWLLFHQIVISCTNGACMQQTNEHMQYLLQVGGMLELVFEIGGVVKIYVKNKMKK